MKFQREPRMPKRGGAGEPSISPEQMLPLLARATHLSTVLETGVETRPLPVPTFGQSAGKSRSGLRGYAGSIAIHVCAVVLLFAVSFQSGAIRRVVQRVVLIAPELKPYEPPKPHVVPVQVRPFIVTPPVPPPIPAPVKVAIAAPPVLIQTAELPRPVLPQPKIEVVEPPRPQVVQGAFARAEAARAPEPAKQIVQAGFGDPQGVAARSQTAATVTMAKLGGFDVPADIQARGTPQGVVGPTAFGSVDAANGKGAGSQGAVHAGGFGDSAGTGTGPGGAHSGPVRAGGFADGAIPSARPIEHAQAAPPTSTSPEILFKPKPAYTDEARTLRIEGQVLLEVTLRADGTIQIVRVIRGLGHGLDETAAQAARQMRFRPATRAGIPVDVNATLTITFQLT
jgi:TonB family protein